MKRISGSHYFLHLFANPTRQHLRVATLSLCECELVFCSVLRRVYIGRIYISMAKDSKFHRSIQVTWKRRAIGKSELFEHIRWYSNTKADKYSSCFKYSFFISVRGGRLFSGNRLLLYYFELILTATSTGSSK